MRTPTSLLGSGGLAFLLYCAAASSGRGSETSWNNFPIGDWYVAGNWTNGVPGGAFVVAQDAFITNGGTALLNQLEANPFGGPGFPAQALDVSVGFVHHTSGTLLVTRLGAGVPASLHLSNFYIGVGGGPGSGTGATGNVTISSGASVIQSVTLFFGFTYVGLGSQAAGTLTVRDPGSLLQTDYLIVGDDTSVGTLNLQSGAQILSGGAFLAGSPIFATVANGSSGTATVTGAGSIWTIGSSLNFEIGSKGAGNLTISSGGLVNSSSASLASSSGSTGIVTVTGANSTWNSTGNIFVGGRNGANGGAGTLQIFSGGLVKASAVRNFANSLVNVSNGSVSVPGLIVSGGASAPSGGGTTGDLVVANNAAGRMEIRTGGRVSNLRGYIGQLNGADGAATVSGAGSRWDCSGSIWAGNSGLGSLEITDGAVVTSAGNGYLGFSTNSSGYINVSGAGSTLTYGVNLYIGGNGAAPGGSGTLVIQDGGAVSAAAATLYVGAYLALGASSSLNAAFNVNGGYLQAVADNTFTNNFSVGALGVGVFTSTRTMVLSGQISGVGGLDKLAGSFTSPNPGTLILTGNSTYGGATVVGMGKLIVDGSITSSVSVNSGATLGGSGAVGNVTVKAGGIVAPGASPGILTVNGNYTQLSGGILNVQLGGNAPGAGGYDQLVVTGMASLNGTLNLSLVDGFRPLPGDTFQIIASAAETGNFSAITASGFTVSPSVSASGVALTLLTIDPLLTVLDVAGSGADLVVTFAAVAGKTYRLERKFDLTTAGWDAVADLAAKVTQPAQITDVGGINQPQAFYRVRLLP